MLFLFSHHILLSIRLHRSLNSYVSVLPRACTWVYKQANFSQKSIVTSAPAAPTAPPLQSSLHHCLLPWSWLRWGGAVLPGRPMPSRPLLFLYRLARVHQEDRSYLFFQKVPCPVDRCCSCNTLLVSTKRTAALHWRGPDHCSRTCSLTHCQCRRIILIAIVIYLAAFWLPKSLDYSGRAIQVHTRERAIQVHTQERAIQVHTQERAIQVHTQ